MSQYQPMEYYLNLPWSYSLEWIDDPYHGENWTVFVKELPGCKTHAKTPEEAMVNIKEAIESYLMCFIEDDDPIPEPVKPQDYLPSSTGSITA